MKNIQDFLGRFLSIKPTSKIIVREYIALLAQEGIPVSEDEVIYSQGVLYMKTHSVVKNEVFLRKEHLLSALNQRLGDSPVKNIR